MPPALQLSAEQQTLAFTRALATAGLSIRPERLWGAKAFCARVGLPADWPALPLAEQLALPKRVRTFVAWLLVTGQLAASADYLVAAPHLIGDVAAHHHPAFHDAFTQTATTLGFTATPPCASGRPWCAWPPCTRSRPTRSPPPCSRQDGRRSRRPCGGTTPAASGRRPRRCTALPPPCSTSA